MGFLLVISSCKKDKVTTNNNNIINNPGWTTAQKASYHRVLALQEQAAVNYDAWRLTTDSLTVINHLQQFFAADTLVTWAVISSQGISVQYKNGMRGGFFLFSNEVKSKKMKPKTIQGITAFANRHLINHKKAATLCTNYWDAGFNDAPFTFKVDEHYLPKIGVNDVNLCLNDQANVNSFASLSGKGFIYISSHGAAWPTEQNIQSVYVETGEVVNDATTEKYFTDVYTDDILVGMSNVNAAGTKKNIYYLSSDFVKENNDFSKDTLLFFGGFCFSALGGWADIQHSFASGGYFGFDWAVASTWCNGWLDDLMYNMTDTSLVQSFTAKNWMDNSYSKLYWSATFQKNVSINYFGDPDLTLWKGGLFIGRAYKGGRIFYIDDTGQHGLIGDTILTAEWVPWDCDTIWSVTATGYGTGMANTAALANTCNANGAAHICNNLGRNGYNDWYLPSKDELNLLYLHKNLFNRPNDMYWSSSEYPDLINYQASGIWAHNFQTGQQQKTNILSTIMARAIRSF